MLQPLLTMKTWMHGNLKRSGGLECSLLLARRNISCYLYWQYVVFPCNFRYAPLFFKLFKFYYILTNQMFLFGILFYRLASLFRLSFFSIQGLTLRFDDLSSLFKIMVVMSANNTIRWTYFLWSFSSSSWVWFWSFRWCKKELLNMVLSFEAKQNFLCQNQWINLIMQTFLIYIKSSLPFFFFYWYGKKLPQSMEHLYSFLVNLILNY